MFHGAATLIVVALVRRPLPLSPLSLFTSNALSDWLIENAWSDRHGIGCGSQR